MSSANQPASSEVVDISSTNHTFVGKTTGIRCDAAGTVIAKLRGDNAARTYTVSAGEILWGDFESVTKTNTTLTGAGQMLAYLRSDS